MDVYIKKQRVDDAGNLISEITQGEDSEQAQKRLVRGYVAPPKPTAFMMFNHFKANVPCVNIDGTLHLYDFSNKYYRPVEQRELEEFLLNRYFDMVEQSGSLRIVKTCAELIMKKKPVEVSSAEKNMILCFQNGYLPIGAIEDTWFQPYEQSSLSQVPIFPTYLINADGYANMGAWNNMKVLLTPYMSAFLSSVTRGNRIIEERIWQMIGYLLTPDMNGKCFFVLQGVPNSGKSILGNFIKALLSAHRVESLDIDQLGKKNATSLLVNKSINISMDLPNKTLSPLAIRNLKLMTGNDDITVEYSNGKLERYHGCCKFLFATNHPLTLKGTDAGFEERIVAIPFTNSIPANQRDFHLLDNLLREKDAIVAKALAHYCDLRKNNYIFAGADSNLCKIKTHYLPTEAEDMDANLCRFVEERCEFVSHEYGTYTEELYHAYLIFCDDYGETPIDNLAVFSKRLLRCYGMELIKKKWRRGNQENRWGFRGILIQPMITMREDGCYNV